MAHSVVVIDDDEAFRRLASRLLAGLGLMVVAEAGTCGEAHVVLDELRPDAAQVDVGLPDGDGLVLARELAGRPWRPRVVLTSSDPDASSTGAARAAGAIGFVPKAELTNGSLRAMLVRD